MTLPAPAASSGPGGAAGGADGSPDDDLARRLGTVLEGEVRDVRLISGGASRRTSGFDLVAADGTVRPLIIQQDRGKGIAGPGRVRSEVALLGAAGAAGVPVPGVWDHGDDERDGLGPGWLVVDRLDGETIPRKILRDPEWTAARAALTGQCGRALAAIHGIDPVGIEGLAQHDSLEDPLAFLDALGEVRPALEFGARWLKTHRPPAGPRVAVHGDFRLGNLLIGPDGLRAVLDWELAHAGDAAEDLAWLCAPAWRFGGTKEVGGFGDVGELLAAYTAAGGEEIDAERLRWWMVFATVKWAAICAMQAGVPLGGAARTVESVAIGRRVCESEWDLFVLLGLGPTPEPASSEPSEPSEPTESDTSATVPAPFGRPTAAELIETVRDYLGQRACDEPERGARFAARVAGNVLSMVEREMRLGPLLSSAHRRRLRALGFADDRALAAAIRSGACDTNWSEVGRSLAASARDQLRVANPTYSATTSA
jgi:aminoglycoside phosphotransferase (APT) family kinase protein